MNRWLAIGAAFLGLTVSARAERWLDRVDDALSWASESGEWRAHVSGLTDLEGYALPDPAPGVIDAEGRTLFNPRLSVFLDAQLGPHVYAFAQARADRGFDPSNGPLTARLDEYALRWEPDRAGRFSVQVGAFATVVGDWTERHDSWTNPFITAPLPYENLTGVWDSMPPHSANQLLAWAHVRPAPPGALPDDDKYLRIPIIWGPSYATGAAIAGELGKWRYAVELKNASLSSRPATWQGGDWSHPTLSGRVRFLPDETWAFGWSASSGSFLRPEAAARIPAGHDRGDYRETVVGQDISYAWHHLQVWAEVYGARFQLARIGNADTAAYYVEAKYRFAPQFSGALRWNQQVFGTVPDRGAAVRWGSDVWRIDLAPAYRFTPHKQLKLQYSLQHGNNDTSRLTQLLAVQLTVRW